MDWNQLFVNPEVMGNIIGAVLGFIFGIIATFLVQSRQSKQSDVEPLIEISYSRRVEIPLKIAKAELKNKLKIIYQEKEIQNLYFFTLYIENTGERTIRNQTFTCLFSDGTKLIDPVFPRIRTNPKREVGPIERDSAISAKNEFRFTIQTFGINQSVKIEFLTVENESTDFDVIFKPNEGAEVNFREITLLGKIKLSQRETEIIELLAKGHTASQIADQLSLRRKTVENMIPGIKKKFRADSSAQLIHLYYQRNEDE